MTFKTVACHFAGIFHGLNEELLRLGLVSPEMSANSSLVKANVNSHQLSRSWLTMKEFREQAIEDNGLFVLSESSVDEDGVEREGTRNFQDSKGLLRLIPVGHFLSTVVVDVQRKSL